MSKHLSVRLDDATQAEIEAVAAEYGMEFSSAARWALKRGLKAIKGDKETAPTQRRKMLSKGVG